MLVHHPVRDLFPLRSWHGGAVVAVLCCWVTLPMAGAQERNDERERAIAEIEKLGGRFQAGDPERNSLLGALKGRQGMRRERVILNETPVTDADLALLKGLPDLEELHLFDTTISDTGLSHLVGLKSLRFLNLNLYCWRIQSGTAGTADSRFPAIPSCPSSGRSTAHRNSPTVSSIRQRSPGPVWCI